MVGVNLHSATPRAWFRRQDTSALESEHDCTGTRFLDMGRVALRPLATLPLGGVSTPTRYTLVLVACCEPIRYGLPACAHRSRDNFAGLLVLRPQTKRFTARRPFPSVLASVTRH